MQQAKSERLLNLVICLLVARGYVPKSRIRQIVGGYGDQTDDAFERMFERDKEDLREVGIPIETGSNDPFGDDEPGYRIQRDEFELPDIRLEPDEAAAVGMAARMWQDTNLAQATNTAVLKLQAVGVAADTRTLGAVEPRVGGEDPAFWPLWEAVRDRRAVRFDHRKGTGAPALTRHVQPWSVLSWHGRWYVVGHDVDRGAARMFRLSRIVGDVEPVGRAGAYDVPPLEQIRAAAESLAPSTPGERRLARILVRPGAGYALRRRARSVESAPTDGWEVVTVSYASTDRLIEELAALGPDVVVLEPDDLRARMIAWLSAVPGVRP
jgi:predicted DNA-binding transcriptional regulator YafY